MPRQIDFAAEAEIARRMETAELKHALCDAINTAHGWDRRPDLDPDGNGGFYHDQASVYRAELRRRGVDYDPTAADLAEVEERAWASADAKIGSGRP